MPRYDDRYASTRLYVGHLAARTRSRDLEHLFSKYGRVRDVDMKRDYAFVEFSDPRDADDARHYLDGKEFDGSRIIVEFAKGVPRGSREYLGRGPPPGSGRCFNCGIDGHWARDCKAGDWKNKCYRCGERGHIERNCKNSPKKLTKRGRSYSRSPGRSHSPHRGRSRSPSYSRGRSYSRSRSPPPKRERSVENEDRSLSPEPRSSKARKRGPTPDEDRSLSPELKSSKARKRSPTPDEDRSLSPEPRSSKGRKRSPTPDEDRSLSPELKSSKGRKRSPTPDEGSPRPSRKLDDERDREYSGSPTGRSRSPRDERYRSPSQTNGRSHSRSPSLRDDRSPADDDYEDNNRSPRDSDVSR